MAATSTMLELGTEAPDFTLPDVTTARMVRRSDFDDRKALLVMFICRHCPYVVHAEAPSRATKRKHLDAALKLTTLILAEELPASTWLQSMAPARKTEAPNDG